MTAEADIKFAKNIEHNKRNKSSVFDPVLSSRRDERTRTTDEFIKGRR